MTARRFHTSPTATPARTGGDDRPKPACLGKSEPFDALVDLTAGPGFKEAQRQARALCGVRDDGMFRAPEERCPLAATCLMRDNADEPWARAVLGTKLPATARASCGKAKGVRDHSGAGETNCDACREFMRNQWTGRKRPERAITHGTDTGYSRHRKAGEEACEPCKEAHRKMVAIRAARKREGAAA